MTALTVSFTSYSRELKAYGGPLQE
jgi:hypothetical protein